MTRVRPDSPQFGRVHRLDRRLDAELVARLVAEYEAGIPTTQLARDCQLAKGSVLKLLHDSGATVRRRKLTVEQIEAATRLYQSGRSFTEIGEELEVGRSTIWRMLKDRGVHFPKGH